MFSKTVVTAFVLTAIALMVYPVNEAESEEYVTRSLIGYWTMDRADINGQIVRDISGNNNHGVIMGNPQIAPGKIGEALDFDGVDDFVALPDLGHNREVTVEVWAKIDRPIGVREVYGLVSTFGVPHQMPGSVVTFSVRFNVEFNEMYLSRHDETLHTSGRSGPVKPYTWYHFAYTCDVMKPGHELTSYYNGKGGPRNLELAFQPNRELPKVGASPINLTRLRIGSELKGRYFPGILDEGRIYNRALTPDEIRQNFEYRNNARVVDARRKLAVTWGVLKTTKH
jgi:hypothetical protein